MINIRHGLFETNSSSTHAICMAKKNDDLVIPTDLTFTFGDFGWDERFYYNVEDKASYFYTALYNSYDEDIKKNFEDIKNHIYEVLFDAGCKCSFEEPKLSQWGSWMESGYIDHQNEIDPWLHKMIKNDKLLFRFLFSPDSFIVTGNDNSYWFDDWEEDFDGSEVAGKVDVFYKGN